jgi:hypothetical protein
MKKNELDFKVKNLEKEIQKSKSEIGSLETSNDNLERGARANQRTINRLEEDVKIYIEKITNQVLGPLLITPEIITLR